MNAEGVQAGIWTVGVRLHSYDVDFKRRATLDAVCRYFLDAAWNHAEALGVGYTHLADQKKFWVLSRFVMKIQRLPQWGENVTLNTWPRAPRGIFALRDFEVVDSQGARVVGGASAWLVLDAHSRRPQRLDKLQWSLKRFPVERATEQEPQKLAERDNGAECFSTLVRYGDLDVNDHVNSASYIRWLLDAYPAEFHRKHTVRLVEVNYLGETKGGQKVSVLKTDGEAGQFWHEIRAEAEVTCRARLLWDSQRTE
ncbi:MAG TPA: acyl-ACP thioesterase domain-containing protein [Candidatus Acidoferrum sp.]|jgi:medium-chain acyl-[acyl-carrier-protein] hydrolase|nr:acyl-ACP thioesterase domain-containing protein [Candidatus Acidoferrum sp.]